MEVEADNDFGKLIKEFVFELRMSFGTEYGTIIDSFWTPSSFFDYIDDLNERKLAVINSEQQSIAFLHTYCKPKLLQHMYDIMNEHEELFSLTSIVDTVFLPNIRFAELFNLNMSSATKEALWQYLKSITCSLMNSPEDIANLCFNGLDTDNEFVTHMKEAFNAATATTEAAAASSDAAHTAGDNSSFTGGATDFINDICSNYKVGKLAHSIISDMLSELGININEPLNMNDIQQKLMKNSAKIAKLIKKLISRLENCTSSGEITPNEFKSEIFEIIEKLKLIPGINDVPGMSQMFELLSKMGNGDKNVFNQFFNGNANSSGSSGNSNSNINSNSSSSSSMCKYTQQMKMDIIKERLRQKRAAKHALSTMPVIQPQISEEVRLSIIDSLLMDEDKNKNAIVSSNKKGKKNKKR